VACSSRTAKLVCKPSSVPCACRAAAIYLGRQLPAGSSGLPGALETSNLRAIMPRPCLALLPVGFASASRSPGPPVVSYTTFSPLPHIRVRRSVFCGTFRRVAPPGCYPAPCSVELGLSSGSRAARGRPANLASAGTIIAECEHSHESPARHRPVSTLMLTLQIGKTVSLALECRHTQRGTAPAGAEPECSARCFVWQ